MKRLFCMAALAAAAAFAEDKAAAPTDPAAAPAKMAMPKPPEEMAVEKWFVGTWNCKGQQHAGPMGPEMAVSSRLEMKLELAGFWLQVKGTMRSGPMKGKEAFEGFAGYVGTQHERYDFQPGGMVHFTTKGWDGDKLVFEGEGMMGGQKLAMRHSITKKGDHEFGSVFESEGKTVIDETCTRAGAAQK